jgi:acetyl coenzyme A synthetase (ADP forming)-like protein
VESLNKLFAPKTIAVIGASRRNGSLGKMFLDAMIRMKYKGRIFPVNPKADKINSIPCYPDITSLPEIPDLAVILLPKELVLETVKELASQKIRNIVVISAGFREVGDEGIERETALINLIQKYGMRMIGPNSMGLFNTAPDLFLNATFSPTLPLVGHVGFISQSGALGVAVLELSRNLNLGFSTFVSTGNKADIGDVECLQFMGEDENTNVIILYQEGIDKPALFRSVATRIAVKKPVLTLKAGRTKSGHKAASSHTGALASDDKITDAFIKQCGIIRCETLQEILDTARAFASQPLPNGNKVAIITNAGGPGILTSDALEKYNLDLTAFEKKTVAKLKKVLPAEAGVEKPVDMIASATHDTYREVFCIVQDDPNVDAIVIIIVKPPVDTTPKKIISNLKPFIKNCLKPVFCTLMAQHSPDTGMEIFQEEGVPVYSYPEAPARVLGNMAIYGEIRARFLESKIHDKIKDIDIVKDGTEKQQMSFKTMMKMLSQSHIKTCPWMLGTDINDFLDFKKKHDKIVLKIANENVIHKSEHGLVKLGLASVSDVEDAFDEITENAKKILPDNERLLFVAQKMISGGIEFVLGAKQDAQYGPVIMFGIGGVFVELYKDVVFRILPIDMIDVKLMVNELSGNKIFDGFRNLPAVNREILYKTILDFSKMVWDHPEITEIDLNPLLWMVEKRQLIVLDSRCTMQLDS